MRSSGVSWRRHDASRYLRGRRPRRRRFRGRGAARRLPQLVARDPGRAVAQDARAVEARRAPAELLRLQRSAKRRHRARVRRRPAPAPAPGPKLAARGERLADARGVEAVVVPARLAAERVPLRHLRRDRRVAAGLAALERGGDLALEARLVGLEDDVLLGLAVPLDGDELARGGAERRVEAQVGIFGVLRSSAPIPPDDCGGGRSGQREALGSFGAVHGSWLRRSAAERGDSHPMGHRAATELPLGQRRRSRTGRFEQHRAESRLDAVAFARRRRRPAPSTAVAKEARSARRDGRGRRGAGRGANTSAVRRR